jgi:PAS domain S-box-containing protein
VEECAAYSSFFFDSFRSIVGFGPQYLMMKQPHCASKTQMDELLENLPLGLALLELFDPSDVSTWRLAAINNVASSLVAPSVETFLSSARLRVSSFVDLPNLYREVISKRRPETVGIIEGRGSAVHNARLSMVSAFPAGTRSVGISFEDISIRTARALAERQLAQTCKFVGAILWKAEPQTLQFTYVSAQARAILGYWLERWTGETNFWKKHLFPDDRERVASVCEKISRERNRRDFEFRMIGVHGQIVWFHAAAEIAEQRGRPPELVGAMNDITDLKRAEERIRALSSRLMRLQNDERRHISRELHDSLGQYLTSIKINMELVKRESTTIEERHRVLLAESSETLEKCVQEVRTVSYLLHPPLLDELGLLAALQWFTAAFSERSGIKVNLNAPREFSRLPEEMELALFRIVQESLTNVQLHSRSDAAWVTLSENEDRAEIRISDGGVGVPPSVIEQIKQGRAIEGIGFGECTSACAKRGQLEIESSRMGTAVSGVFPLKRAQTGDEDEERKSRLAGKRLEMTDLRIDDAAIEANGTKEARREGREFRAAHRRRRGASRRLR